MYSSVCLHRRRIQNRTKICTVPSVYTEDEFRTVLKCVQFRLFTPKTNSEPYQNLHSSVCLHRRRIQNRTKMCTVPSVYTEDEFRTVPKFAQFRLFTPKTNSEPYQNLYSSVCLHRRRIQNRTNTSSSCLHGGIVQISVWFRIRPIEDLGGNLTRISPIAIQMLGPT